VGIIIADGVDGVVVDIILIYEEEDSEEGEGGMLLLSGRQCAVRADLATRGPAAALVSWCGCCCGGPRRVVALVAFVVFGALVADVALVVFGALVADVAFGAGIAVVAFGAFVAFVGAIAVFAAAMALFVALVMAVFVMRRSRRGWGMGGTRRGWPLPHCGASPLGRRIIGGKS